MRMTFRTRPVQLEARSWDGSVAAGLDLCTWVQRSGGQAHLNTSYGRTTVQVWHTVGTQQTMRADVDFLVRNQDDGRFHVVPRQDIEAEYDLGDDGIFRSRPVELEGWDWNGGFKAGLDLVTWVRTNGGKAHLDERRGGRPAIMVGDEEMVPDLDVLLRDGSGRFFVRDRRFIAAEYVQDETVQS